MRIGSIAAVLLFIAGCSSDNGGGSGNNRPPSGKPPASDLAPSPGPGPADMAQMPPSQQPDFSMMPSPMGDMAVPPAGDMAMGPPSNCDYPKSGFGTKEGDVLDPGKMYECYAPGGGDTTVKFTPKELFDCDGKLGINAIILDSGGVGCGACEQMSTDMPNDAKTNMWKELGIRAILTVNNPYGSAMGTIQDAKDWRDKFKLQDTAYVCSATSNNDVNYGFSPSVPVIDPRSMKFSFVPTRETYTDGAGKAVELAKKNKK